MKRADANSWGDGDEDGKGEWVVKKVAAKAKKGLLRPSWGSSVSQIILVANVFLFAADTHKRCPQVRTHGPDTLTPFRCLDIPGQAVYVFDGIELSLAHSLLLSVCLLAAPFLFSAFC